MSCCRKSYSKTPNMSSLMEEREDLIMLPPLPGISTSRKSHFLKPITNNIQSLPSPPPVLQNPEDVPFKIIIKGGCPQKNWKKWVHHLLPLHQHAWLKAGIFEALLASTYKIQKQKRLFIALAERWCCETNTFVFPWGEATLTLEDLVVLGGYSVLGKPVFDLLDSDDMITTHNRLRAVCIGKMGSYYAWLDYFMGKGGEMEHVAFLILWLSRYVFPIKHNIIAKNVFPIAVHLSKGVQIALAPAVLASIYKDLSLLKRLMVAFSKNNGCGFEKHEGRIAVWSPLYFVQLWAWERFPKLRPNPSSIKYGEPRLARWDKLGESNFQNFRELIDCSGESFQWRPYAVSLENWEFDKWYKADEMYVLVDSEMEMDVEEFVRLVRVSELVGLNCIEHYSPHRVAMQFGFDQDIPGFVNKQSGTPQMAWSYYNRPITSSFVYVPSKLFEAGVSSRYFKWWYHDELGAEDGPQNCRQLSEVYDIMTAEDRSTIDPISSDEEDGLSISQFLSSRKKQKVFEHKNSGETLVQCGTLSPSVVEYYLPSTGTPKRDTVCMNVTQLLPGNLDRGEGDNSDSSDVKRNGPKCHRQKICTLVEDQGGSEIKLAGRFEENVTTPENMTANLYKSPNSSKDTERGISSYGDNEVTKEIESRLRTISTDFMVFSPVTKHQSGPSLATTTAAEDELPQEYEKPLQTITSTDENSAIEEPLKWPGWPGCNVYRLIVPTPKVGSIIGCKGELVKKMCEETGARVHILDAPVRSSYRVVIISGKEEPAAELSPAMDAALKVFKCVSGLTSSDGRNPDVETVGAACCSMKLLMALSQVVHLIGKQGSTIKFIQESSGAAIRILTEAELPSYATSEERVVDIYGEAMKVLQALREVVVKLRRFLVDQTVVPIFEKNHNACIQPERGAGSRTNNSSSLQPTASVPYLPHPVKRGPYLLDREPHVDSKLPSYGANKILGALQSSVSGRTVTPVVTQMTKIMQLPRVYAEDIIGIGGIAYIRRNSGAVVTVEESGCLGDKISIEIKGTALQVEGAEQLIHGFVNNQKPKHLLQ